MHPLFRKKHTSESQEKFSESLGESSNNEKPKSADSFSSFGGSSTSMQSNTDSLSSLGDSMINETPYYESSRFINKQLNQERKLGVLGEGDGREKGDEACSEKGGSQVEGGEMGEAKDEKGYGEGRCRGGVKVKGMDGSGSTEGSDVKGSSVKVEGYGEGRARGGRRGEQMDKGGDDVEGSWMHVEGEGVVGKGADGGVGDLMKSVDGGKQQGRPIVDEGQRNKTKEAVDEESVCGADAKLVGGEKQMEEKINVGEEDKVKINMEDTKEMSHVEDIPSDKQTEDQKQHSNAEDEIPGDVSTQIQSGR